MARDGISVDSSPRDLMASTNSERAVTEGCSDPRTTNLELQASETRAHCSKPTEPKCAPGFLVVPAQGWHDEVAMFDTSRCLCRHGVMFGQRRPTKERPKIRPLGERHLEVEAGQSLLKTTPRGRRSHTVLWAVGSLQLAEQGDARPRPGAA